MTATKVSGDKMRAFWKTPAVTGAGPGNGAPVLYAGPTDAGPGGDGTDEIRSGDGSGSGGSDLPPADMIKQLSEWEKKGKVTGDVSGLRKRLGSKDPQVVLDAEDEFKDARDSIAKGEPFHVEADSPHEAPKSKRISTPNKINLRDLPMVKSLVPDTARQAALGDWIDKNHDLVQKKIKKSDTKRGGSGHDGHDHMDDHEVEEIVRLWQDTEGITEQEKEIRNKRDDQKIKKKGGGGEGSGGQEPTSKGTGDPKAHEPTTKGTGDPKTGGTTAPQTPADPKSPTKPAPAPEPQNNSQKLQGAADALSQRAEAVDKKYDELEKKLDKNLSEAEEGKLRKESDAVRKEAEAIERDAESLAKQLQAEPELAGIRGSTPAETLRNAKSRFGQGAAAAGTLAHTAMTLANAYFIAQDVKYIFEADTAIEGLSRAVEVGANMAVGAAEVELVQYVTRTGPFAATAAVMFFNALCDGSECDRRKTEEVDKERAKLRDRLPHDRQMAVAKFLEKHYPGSVTISNGDDKYGQWVSNISDKKLWDATVKKVAQMRKANERERGAKDGTTGIAWNKAELEQGIYLNDGERADALKNYDAGFQAGVAMRKAAIQRAHAVGLEDGKAGKPANFEAVKNWPEVKELLQLDLIKNGTTDQVATGQGIFNQYEDNYNKGYQEGFKAAKSLVVTDLTISPNGFTMGAYTQRNLTVIAVLSDNSKKNVGGEIRWQSSDENVVKMYVNDGLVTAFLLNMGRAEITGSYEGVHGSRAGKITIIVNPPVIEINPNNPTLKVGAKQRFRAYSVDKANDGMATELDATVISWGSGEKSRIALDADGNATVLAAGPPVQITASHKSSPAQGRTKVTVG